MKYHETPAFFLRVSAQLERLDRQPTSLLADAIDSVHVAMGEQVDLEAMPSLPRLEEDLSRFVSFLDPGLHEPHPERARAELDEAYQTIMHYLSLAREAYCPES